MEKYYQLLGLESNASKEEVKVAFRKISDGLRSKQGTKEYENKVTAVQNAYFSIMNKEDILCKDTWENLKNLKMDQKKENKGTYEKAKESILAKKFQQAYEMLNNVWNKDSQWHYLYAFANYGMGNNMQAVNHAKTAAAMAPEEGVYSDLVKKMGHYDDRYYRDRRHHRGCSCCCCDDDMCECCAQIWCADTCCECMGGDLCDCF